MEPNVSNTLNTNAAAPRPANDSGASALDQAREKLDDARESATEAVGDAKERATEAVGSAKERATQLKATLADKLEAGATSLRHRAESTSPQLATADGSAPAQGLLDSDQVKRLATPAADAMEKTADFLRNGDMKAALEEQVRTNPGRTLLIALGLGYIAGKALRR